MREPFCGSNQLSFLENFEAFDASRPLMPGASTITIAQALLCEFLHYELMDPPSAEASGAALIDATDMREVRNVHLEAPRVLFNEVPENEDAMRERIEWMFHAGSRSTARSGRALEAVGIMIDQVTLDAEFDAETLASTLSHLADRHPKLVDALFRGDLDDVPDLVEQAIAHGADSVELIAPAAWMFVTWGALEQQREASLGWRLIHRCLDEAWSDEIRYWTIGQIFEPQSERYALANEMRRIYFENRQNGVDRVKDGRTINRFERSLRNLGLGGVNRHTEKEVIAAFGHGRLGRIPELLARSGSDADSYYQRYRTILTAGDGKSRGGQRADMLAASISAVTRTAIVCARTYNLARLATKARTPSDLRAMLDARLPHVLRPCESQQRDWGKGRLRQLFHVVRVEFLQDGQHLPKGMKRLAAGVYPEVPLELSESEERRGHELFDQCWAALHDQPSDWQFVTPFGWQCDGVPRVRFSAACKA